jgi:uncharacterized protein YeaO (DUF488 family)
MNMIQIKRVYEPAEKSDGWRVLVDRLWPRGIKKDAAKVDVWMKEIAPSDELRKWFGHDAERWPEFQRRYRTDLIQKKQMLADLKRMEKQYGKLTLLFGAKDAEHNQAVVLAETLKKQK